MINNSHINKNKNNINHLTVVDFKTVANHYFKAKLGYEILNTSITKSSPSIKDIGTEDTIRFTNIPEDVLPFIKVVPYVISKDSFNDTSENIIPEIYYIWNKIKNYSYDFYFQFYIRTDSYLDLSESYTAKIMLYPKSHFNFQITNGIEL